MKNFFKKFVLGFIFLLLLTQTSFAQVNNPNYFKKIDNTVFFTSPSWELGSNTHRIANGYFTNIDATSISYSSVGDTTFDGKVTIDHTDTEALLVRKNADAGDVFTVNTTGSIITANGDFKANNLAAFGNNGLIGIRDSYDSIWDFGHTITDFTANDSWVGMRQDLHFDPGVDLTGGNAKFLYGMLVDTSVKSGNSKNFDLLEGVNISTSHNGTGLVSAQAALYVNSLVTSSGNTTQNIGEFINAELTGTGSAVDNIAAYYKSGHSGTGGSITSDKTIVIETPDHARTLTEHIGILLEDQEFGTTSHAIKTEGGKVEIGAATGKTGNLLMTDDDVSNPFTALNAFGLQSNAYFGFIPVSGTAGGGRVFGFSDNDTEALAFSAAIGSTTPTKAAMTFTANKFDGVSNTSALGTGELAINFVNGTTSVMRITGDNFVGIGNATPAASLDVTQAVGVTGSPTAFKVTGASHTTLTAATESTDINFNLARTVQFATGAITTNRSARLQAATWGFVGASTVTNGITFDLSGAPSAGTNATILNPSALRVGGAATYPSNANLAYQNVLLGTHTITLTGTTQVTSTVPQSQLSVGTLTLTDASAVTVDNAASFYVARDVVAGGSVTITNNNAVWVDAGATRLDGRLLEAKGANLTAAGTLTIGTDGTYFVVTGNTNVDYITTTGYTAGSIVRLNFTGTPTLNNNTGSVPGTAAALQLSGSTNFTVGAADATITLVYTGTVWQEVARTAF